MKKFDSALDASSNVQELRNLDLSQAPGGGKLYEPLRKNVVETAIAMGYDQATMTEIAINWSDDHDPFGHVKNHAYGHFFSTCNVRVFHSFEASLGKEKYEDLMNARGIGVMVRSSETRLMRPVKFPDSLIVANHLKEVLPDRYFVVTTIWSLVQQAIVAESSGYMVFFNFTKGKLANMIEAGGVHKDLYDALVKRKEKEEKLVLKWKAAHPKKQKANI